MPTLPRQRALAIVVACVVMVPGCTTPSDDELRTAWLRGVMLGEHEGLLRRDPVLAGAGLRRAARTPHDFLRGTAAVFALDATTPGSPGGWPTAFGDASSARVALVGDPHLENLGTFRPAGAGPSAALIVDWNDFDGATYGPFWLDVRRLALSAAVASRQLGMSDAAQRSATVAVAAGYAETITELAAGGAARGAQSDDPRCVIFADVLDKAASDGAAREELDDYTAVHAGARRLRFGDIEPPIDGLAEDSLLPVSTREWRLVRALLADYPATLVAPLPPGALVLKDVGRRLGAGVRSYALLRYYALVEGPTASSDDDWLLEIKEVAPPMAYGGLEVGIERGFGGNGERQVVMQRCLQAVPDADALLGWAEAQPMGFKIRERTKLQRGIDLVRVAEKRDAGTWTDDDVIALAREAGRLLARAHAFAAGPDGTPGLAVIAPRVVGRGDRLVDETTAWALGYAEVLAADHARYVWLLMVYGDTLGFR